MLGNIMKQAQKMQEKMQQAQEEIAKLTMVGEAGGGMVKVTMNGKHVVQRVEIDDSAVSDDKDMLEDLITAAINDAVSKVDKETKDKMAEITGGLNLPPGMKLPF